MKHHIGLHHINTWQKFLLVFAIISFGIFGAIFSIKFYPEVFNTNSTVQKTMDIRPNEAVVVNFSVPMFTDIIDSETKIIPTEEYQLQWENSNKKLKIIPKNFWKPETRYEIFLPQSKNIMFLRTNFQPIIFLTEKYPQVEKIFPEDNSQDVIIDIEDPIVVDFKKSTTNFSVKFILNGQSSLYFESDVGETKFKLMPKNKIEYGTKYILEIYAKYKKDKAENYQKILESSFETIPPPEIIWDEDKNKRLEQARRYTRAKIKEGKYIDINLEAQVLSIFEEGNLIDSFMISSGKKGMDTPKIQTKISNKAPRAFSKKYGLFMPFWMSLTQDGKFGIHELPEWPSGYKEGAAHLGIPVSHGCVRLGVGSAKKVYEWTEIGTPVVIY